MKLDDIVLTNNGEVGKHIRKLGPKQEGPCNIKMKRFLGTNKLLTLGAKRSQALSMWTILGATMHRFPPQDILGSV